MQPAPPTPAPPTPSQPQQLSRWLLAAAAAVVLALAWLTTTPIGTQLTAWLTPVSDAGDQAIARAFQAQRSGVQVASDGVVERVLSDDNAGSRHQRFILRLDSGHNVLVAHNIDRAPRLRALKPGDRVAFFGEYAWNGKGGVIHWTHNDPNGRHIAGWLSHNDQRVQ
ncbi:MAG: DUF3465 domain-containing protein [Cyanobacteria bacterium]|nr:DUF3465 domain-containing protein [Cyanobacteriota bacterium]